MTDADIQQQIQTLSYLLVGALGIDVALLLYWGWRRLVRRQPAFAPRWSVVDLWIGTHLIGALLLFLLVPLLVITALLPWVKLDALHPNQTTPDMLLYVFLPGAILQNLAFFLVPAAFISLKYRLPLRAIGLPPLPRQRDLVAGVLLGLTGLVLSGVLSAGLTALAEQFRHVEWVGGMLAYEKNNPVAEVTRMLPQVGLPALILGVLGIGIAAPIGEEMLFRGFAQNVLSVRFGPRAGLVLSALIFTLPHTYSLIGLFDVFLIGLGLGWVYRTSGSLWTAITLHAVNNTLLVLIAYFLPHLNV